MNPRIIPEFGRLIPCEFRQVADTFYDTKNALAYIEKHYPKQYQKQAKIGLGYISDYLHSLKIYEGKIGSTTILKIQYHAAEAPFDSEGFYAYLYIYPTEVVISPNVLY